MPTAVVEDLANVVAAELARRRAEPDDPEPRVTLEERPAPTGCFRLELVKCGKARCKCSRKATHGPYWYLYARGKGERLSSRYIGKPGSANAREAGLGGRASPFEGEALSEP